ncbi:hypothetical protein [Pseudonocardia acaciae]|uniref:hypothetical protein n=1 Tax=Pseudonocardia acaciae TaxID=551276 RepID=UPI00048B2C3C|nr:hypothetical protein [Pseudonocardia acaciae]
MSWRETHLYYAALREVEQELDGAVGGVLPWRAEYAEIFGDRHGLLLALWRRWEVMVQAKVERPYDPGGRATAPLRELAAAHPGLVRAIRANTEDLDPGLTVTDPAGAAHAERREAGVA